MEDNTSDIYLKLRLDAATRGEEEKVPARKKNEEEEEEDQE